MFRTYKSAASQLESIGYKYETGMPLAGCRFKNAANQYAVILRIGDGKYQASIYA